MSQSPLILNFKDESSSLSFNTLNINDVSPTNSDKAQHVSNSSNTSPKSAISLSASAHPYALSNNKTSTTPKLTIKSISSDQDDIIENMLDATERRASWQVVRSQKSYVPSLSAICK